MAKSLPFATQDNQYPFNYLRMGQLGYNSPGIVLSGDMQVSPGTGLQVQISAGEAYVQQTVARLGSFYAQRGVYQIFDDSVDNPYNTITAPVTYSRVDQVIARVYDSYEQSLSGSSYWRYEWLPGTETSGAQINNPSGSGYLAGAAALPDNSLRLAYCLATVSMSSWSSGNIANVVTLASRRGIANGVATLDSTGNVPEDELGNILTCAFSQPARSAGTVYQPNLSRPTFVAAVTFGTLGLAYIGATSSPATEVANCNVPSGGNGYQTLSFLVPASWYYKITVTGSSVAPAVSEWTL